MMQRLTFDPHDPALTTSTIEGQRVLSYAVAVAERVLGPRLVASYALGSLAHGGFSEHVSDVDFALLLTDPIEDSDEARVAAVVAEVKAARFSLGDRLSAFWGSVASLKGSVREGRFPPHDRLDLLRNGRLLSGTDVRAELTEPSAAELVAASAAFALQVMAVPARVTDGSLDATALLLAPERLLSEETVRVVTKLILFPVRFLYTLRTGGVGTTADAVHHFVQRNEGHPSADLVMTGLYWRTNPPATQAEKSVLLPLLSAEMVPLYLTFIDDYLERLQHDGLTDLASGMSAWRERLATPSLVPGGAGR
jgi:hypothetical protein